MSAKSDKALLTKSPASKEPRGEIERERKYEALNLLSGPSVA